MQTALLWAAGGTGFTFLMTTLGAASVFLFRKRKAAEEGIAYDDHCSKVHGNLCRQAVFPVPAASPVWPPPVPLLRSWR